MRKHIDCAQRIRDTQATTAGLPMESDNTSKQSGGGLPLYNSIATSPPMTPARTDHTSR